MGDFADLVQSAGQITAAFHFCAGSFLHTTVETPRVTRFRDDTTQPFFHLGTCILANSSARATIMRITTRPAFPFRMRWFSRSLSGSSAQLDVGGMRLLRVCGHRRLEVWKGP